MGCTVSKQHCSNDDDKFDLKGSTALAFFNKVGVVVAAESRASNEWDNDLDKPLQIHDDAIKMHQISTNIISVLVGRREQCRELTSYLRKIFPYSVEDNVYYGEEPKVSYVAETVYKFLVGLRGQNKEFGLLIAGWDPERHHQIYRLIIKQKFVTKHNITAPYGVLGSGHSYAARSLLKKSRCNDYYMSVDAAADLAGEALFNATFYDRFSGGLLRVWIVSDSGIRTELVQDPFEAYSKYYNVYEEKKTLFLIVISDITVKPIRAQKLVQHFSQKRICVSAAHCVAHRELEVEQQKQRLSFHRLIFNSRGDASKAYALASDHNRTDLVPEFPKQLLLTNVEPSTAELYLNWSSRYLLEYIASKFDGYLPIDN